MNAGAGVSGVGTATAVSVGTAGAAEGADGGVEGRAVDGVGPEEAVACGDAVFACPAGDLACDFARATRLTRGVSMHSRCEGGHEMRT